MSTCLSLLSNNPSGSVRLRQAFESDVKMLSVSSTVFCPRLQPHHTYASKAFFFCMMQPNKVLLQPQCTAAPLCAGFCPEVPQQAHKKLLLVQVSSSRLHTHTVRGSPRDLYCNTSHFLRSYKVCLMHCLRLFTEYAKRLSYSPAPGSGAFPDKTWMPVQQYFDEVGLQSSFA